MNIKPYSPINQDFIWVGEYADGTHLSEYDFITRLPNKFSSIRREDLLRFGLVGHGMKLFFEVFGGYFKIQGNMLEIVYKAGDKEYYLTGQPQMYSDIITYKDAESLLDLNSRDSNNKAINRITQFNVGYKSMLNIDGVNFNFKAVVGIPYKTPVFMHIRLVSDIDLDGELIIKNNGFELDRIKAPLKKGVGGELNWEIR